MNYYIISHSLNNKIVGCYPQVEKAVYNCDVWENPLFIDNVSFIKNTVVPLTANAILEKKAKLTDLISAVILGFSLKLLISGKLKSLFQKYRTDGIEYHEAPVIYRNKIMVDYWVVNPYQFNMEFIDFNNSTINLMENTFTKKEELSIENMEEFFKIKEEVELKGHPFSVKIENLQLFRNLEEDFFVLEGIKGGKRFFCFRNIKKRN